jgi:hypothetical protein
LSFGARVVVVLLAQDELQVRVGLAAVAAVLAHGYNKSSVQHL